MPGFGHVGMGGSVGWADPADGLAFAFVHNRLLTPFVITDHAGFVGIYALIRQAAAKARKRGFRRGDRVRVAVLRAGGRRGLTLRIFQAEAKFRVGWMGVIGFHSPFCGL